MPNHEIKKNHNKDEDDELKKYTNKLIKKLTENLENFSYNKIVANIHEMHSFVSKQIEKNYTKKTLLESYNNILILILPVIPHFAHECLEIIKSQKNNKWPVYNQKFIDDETITVVVQINGKKRGLLNLKKDSDQKEVLSMVKKDERLNKYIESKEIKKQIFVKNKIMNLII